MDPSAELEVRRITHIVEQHDVVVFRFDRAASRLVLDLRPGDDLPVFELIPGTGTVEDRVRLIRSLRPRMPRAEAIRILRWSRSLRGMDELGAWRVLRDRAMREGIPAETVAAVYDALLDEEWSIIHDLIVGGEGTRTLWERRA
jgi:hypothetical protein